MFSVSGENFSGVEFMRLAVEGQEVDGTIIDRIISDSRSKDSPVQYISTDLCKYYIESDLRGFVNLFQNDKDCVITVYQQEIVENVYHWIMFMFIKKSRTFYILDPLSDNDTKDVEKQLYECFNQHHHDNQPHHGNGNNDWNFTERWKVAKIGYSKQTDLTSCGLFCMGYGIVILKKFPNLPRRIHVGSDVSELRMKYVARFLNNAEQKP